MYKIIQLITMVFCEFIILVISVNGSSIIVKKNYFEHKIQRSHKIIFNLLLI